MRLDGRDYFINRLGRFDDPVAQARGQAICSEIWRNAQQGDLALSLNRYRPLVEGRDQDLLDALRALAEEKKQARVTHAYRGFRYIPNSCSGLRWSLVDQSGSDASSKGGLVRKQFDGFYGWRGLVAYMTKGIFSNDDLSKYLCGETYSRLDRLPVSLRSPFAELFE